MPRRSVPLGVYPITVAAGTLTAANYDFTNLVTGTLTVAKAPLTVTANDIASYEGSVIPPLSVSFTGFLIGDNAGVVTGSPTIFTTATPTSPLGNYPILIRLGSLSAANYDFPTLVGGTLTIVAPGGTLVSIQSSDPAPTYGESLTFTATVSPVTSDTLTPTGTVQFLIDNAAVGLPVSLANGSATSAVVAPLSAGSHDVSVVYSGDTVYGDTHGDP